MDTSASPEIVRCPPGAALAVGATASCAGRLAASTVVTHEAVATIAVATISRPCLFPMHGGDYGVADAASDQAGRPDR